MKRLNSLLFATSLAALISGCGGEDVEPQPSETTKRGTTMVRGKMKADGTKSCAGYCGKKAIGCFCDSQCAKYGDCCPDKGDVCDGGGESPKPVKSCAGFCGGQSPAGCWCDSQCVKYGDCCDDKAPLCDAPKSVKCTTDAACGKSSFCALEPGECLLKTKTAAPHEGICKAKPEACIEIYAPVCGCDGKTYDSDCKAWGAGTSVASNGPCEQEEPAKCSTLTRQPCESRSDCQWNSGHPSAGFPAPLGFCSSKPSKPTLSKCHAIDSAYQKALLEAKKCSPWLPTLSCADKAYDSLSCKTCTTFVNVPGVLSQHVDKWNATGCGQLTFPCPAYACPLPEGGSCGVDGTCKDL